MTTEKDFKTSLESLEYLYKTNPLVFYDFRQEVRVIVTTMARLNERYKLQLNDLVRMSNIVSPSAIKPTFLFDQMIRSD